jgi:hypothetical protein
MKKLRIRPVYFAALAGAIAGAAIGIPAWAASSGGDSSAQDSIRRAPMPPPGAAGFAMAFKGAPSGADAKRMRQKLDEFASCMREHGADVPDVRRSHRGVSIQVPPPQSRAVMRKVSNECGMPPPPPRGQLFPLDKQQIEMNRRAIARGKCPPLPPPSLSRHR